MTWEAWISLVLVAGVAIVTPGPGNLNTLRRAVELGYRSAIFSVMGNAAGLMVLGAATGIGLLAMLIASPGAWALFQWVGIGFLLFLGAQMIATSSYDWAASTSTTRTRFHLFAEAAGVSALNPKAALFFVAIFPLYTDPDRPMPLQVFLIVATCLSISVMSHALYILLAHQMRPHLSRPASYRAFRLCAGLVMLGLALWLLMQNVAGTEVAG